MTRGAACGVVLAVLGLAGRAEAATYVATDDNLATIFAKAKAGDTIVLSGRFGATLLQDRSFKTPLKIDATYARFDGALSIRRTSGLTVIGGRFGNGTGIWQNSGTIIVSASSNIEFHRPVLTGDGLGRARGIFFMNSNDFSVTGGTYTGFRLALGAAGSTEGNFVNNRILKSTSDGINISDSHRMIARGNTCSGTNPSEGAHPDCIQLWSLAGKPAQSDIQLLNNRSFGATQGFTSFNPDDGGGIRISMIGNRVDSIFPQGIACYNCWDSIFTDNVLNSLPGGQARTRLNVIGGGNNIIENNYVGPFTRTAAPTSEDGIVLSSQLTSESFGSFDLTEQFDDFSWAYATAMADLSQLQEGMAVPEPATWLQLLTGFALLGAVSRRRSAQLRHQKAS